MEHTAACRRWGQIYTFMDKMPKFRPKLPQWGLSHFPTFHQDPSWHRDTAYISAHQVPPMTRDRRIDQNCTVYLYFIFTIFLLTEQMWQPSKDVSLIIKGKMVSGKCQCFFEETCPRVITIFHTVQRYALSFVRCQACQVWIMGGVVLQALWCQCIVNSEPASTIFM